MEIRYTIHNLPDGRDERATVSGPQARRMLRYLRRYERGQGPLTGRYCNLGITVHEINFAR